MSLTPNKFPIPDGPAANDKQPMQSTAWGPAELDALDAAAVKEDGSGNVSLAGTLSVSGLDVGKSVLENSSTGLYAWTSPGLAKGTGDAQVDVSAGLGHLVNFHDDPSAPTRAAVSWDAQSLNVALANGVTYIYVDSTGTAMQTTVALTATQRRENILLGRAVTVASVVVQTQVTPDVATQPTNQLHSLLDGVGIVNRNVTISNGGSGLTLALSGGQLVSRGSGFIDDPAAPNDKAIAAANPLTFAYATRIVGSTQPDTTLIVPGSYDNAGTIAAITGSGNRATNQRLYLFPSGNVRVQYGQTVYNSLADAVQAAATEPFVINPNVPGNGILLATLSVIKGATNLGDSTQARFLPGGKLGESAFGGAGQSVTTLQQAYNNSTDGTIVTDGTRGPFKVDGDAALPSLPTSDPGVAGRLWVDASAGFALKVSQG